MKRIADDQLHRWKEHPRRKPLIIRGARQVGKTFSIDRFGREHFSSFVSVDLEKNRDWHHLFQPNLDARRVVTELETATGKRILPGETLLFLDEIQACPRAIMALRYLYEELPALHVIAAGSLLEFALEEISFPVGRVSFLDMHPLTFAEFLWARGNEPAASAILSPPERLSDTVHALLLQELYHYFFVGGLPESVRTWVETRSFPEVFAVHRDLAGTYRQDFARYAPRVDPYCLDAVLAGAARSVGNQVKYTRLAEGYSSPTLKRAWKLLCRARLIDQVTAVPPSGLPLGATAGKTFKPLLVDIGLWQHLCGIRLDPLPPREDLLALYQGAMAEQFVGQELRAASSAEMYYWARGERGSSAEVDYLVVREGRIHPVEVKSGSAGRLRSLHLLLAEYPNCGQGLVFSSAPYSELPSHKLLFLPLYYAFGYTRGT